MPQDTAKAIERLAEFAGLRGKEKKFGAIARNSFDEISTRRSSRLIPENEDQNNGNKK